MCKIYLQFIGWKAVGTFPPAMKKAVVVIAPHTSARDFFICIGFRKVLHFEDFKFLGKEELFRIPFGYIFRRLDGVPADRFHNTHFVDKLVEIFKNRSEFILSISPEGTREKVECLRTGFYFIAKKANVPIVMVGLDFENRHFIISPPFYTGDDAGKDFKNISDFFAPIKGKNPKLGLGHFKEYS